MWENLRTQRMDSSTLSIVVRKVDGTSYTVTLGTPGLLTELYDAIAAREGVPRDCVRLVSRGATLPAARLAAGHSLAQHHVADGSAVHVVTRDPTVPPSPQVRALCGEWAAWMAGAGAEDAG
jgi:hypothetical protein